MVKMTKSDQGELAAAIRVGARRGPQCFGAYFDDHGGSCALDQNFLFRPLAQAPGHRTAVENLWHIGASTHPGPGLGAGSGYLVYKELTKPAAPRRLLSGARVAGQRLQRTVARSR